MEEVLAGVVFLVTFCYGHAHRLSRHKGKRVSPKREIHIY